MTGYDDQDYGQQCKSDGDTHPGRNAHLTYDSQPGGGNGMGQQGRARKS